MLCYVTWSVVYTVFIVQYFVYAVVVLFRVVEYSEYYG